jgi:hypothetical protein
MAVTFVIDSKNFLLEILFIFLENFWFTAKLSEGTKVSPYISCPSTHMASCSISASLPRVAHLLTADESILAHHCHPYYYN